MLRVAMLPVVTVFVLACSAAPAVTPQVIYVTPEPARTDAPTPQPTTTPTKRPTPSPFAPPSATAASTVAARPTAPPTAAPSSLGDGIHVVGEDVEPGTYRIREPASFCYWARLSGFSRAFEEIIANARVVDGYAVVTIESSDAGFESHGCGEWSSDLSAVAIPDGAIPSGTLIVGEDIEPGKYGGRGESCYWARLSGFSGEVGDIIKNGLASSSETAVTVKAGDRGFESSGCTWQRR